MADLQKINIRLDKLITAGNSEKIVEFLQSLTDEEELEKINEIMGLLFEYMSHCNDSFNYSPREIDAVREIQDLAPVNTAFLLYFVIKSLGEKTSDMLDGLEFDFS